MAPKRHAQQLLKPGSTLDVEDKVNSGEENNAKAEEQEKVNIGEENIGKAEKVLPRTRKRGAVSPKEPDTSHFKPGSNVEIFSYDAGFRGSWLIGTIIRCVCKKKPAKFLVEYKTLFEDDAGKKPLRETLYDYQLRPVQPPEKRPRKFKFGDEVDAYFNDGWWEGDITGELGGGRFNVFFRPNREQIEFGEESLRIHREWSNGAWVPPIDDEDEGTNEKEEEKKEAKSGVEDMCVQTFGRGLLVEISSDKDGFRGAWFSATIIELRGKEIYVIEYSSTQP